MLREVKLSAVVHVHSEIEEIGCTYWSHTETEDQVFKNYQKFHNEFSSAMYASAVALAEKLNLLSDTDVCYWF